MSEVKPTPLILPSLTPPPLVPEPLLLLLLWSLFWTGLVEHSCAFEAAGKLVGDSLLLRRCLFWTVWRWWGIRRVCGGVWLEEEEEEERWLWWGVRAQRRRWRSSSGALWMSGGSDGHLCAAGSVSLWSELDFMNCCYCRSQGLCVSKATAAGMCKTEVWSAWAETDVKMSLTVDGSAVFWCWAGFWFWSSYFTRWSVCSCLKINSELWLVCSYQRMTPHFLQGQWTSRWQEAQQPTEVKLFSFKHTLLLLPGSVGSEPESSWSQKLINTSVYWDTWGFTDTNTGPNQSERSIQNRISATSPWCFIICSKVWISIKVCK